MELSGHDLATLRRLEEELWHEDTRFDRPCMDRIFAPDFYEIGRSGRIHSREACLAGARQQILAVLPLPEFKVRLLQPGLAQTTYPSAVTYDGIVEHARRSSIWSLTPAGWILRFHQGTPFEKQA